MILPDTVITRAHYDENEDKLIIQRTQDVEPILEQNKRLMNESSSDWRADMHQVASIPMVIIEKYKNEHGIDLLKDKAAMKRFLNDPDNRLFRTKLGVI